MRWMTLLVLTATMIGPLQARAGTLPLPSGIIAFDTAEGEALFIGAEARRDYFQLSIHFVTQINPAYCGPASIAMVLNALNLSRPPSELTLGLGMFDQENIFTPAAEKVKPSAQVIQSGMTLDEFGGMLAAYDLEVEVHHAGESSLGEFRQIAVATLNDDDHFILVNYLRKAIGQEAGGHISPLGAYDADTDQFLILDVSRYKYPPVWVESAMLFSAMNTQDSDNDYKTRGYVLVSR